MGYGPGDRGQRRLQALTGSPEHQPPTNKETSAMTQTIGIIGSGLVGSATARLAIDAGYAVVLSNSRGPESIAGLIRDLGPSARAGNVQDAIAAADFVSIALPLANHATLPVDLLAGKVVIDQTNYYPEFWRNAELDAATLTSSELIQRHLKHSRVVKALHNLDWNHMYSNARAEGDPARTTLPIAGDDADAKQIVTAFIERAGYHVIDAGSLAESWRIEPNTPIYFWPYAPEVPDGLTEDEQKRHYLQAAVPPVTPEAALSMVAGAQRATPAGGTLASMPPAHVAIFMDQASGDTTRK
ncbi:NAD(P)-binding domain-containing protein [Mycobacterium sp. 236(2023)]|uniref:NADPH-dependent F420 reductase n=1 Tax=Mycobacterium sp. 236(2023) TaxID=3038163 RepID=UPI0024156797|nr:NAD(P)-binding domain-containing protein [Mycobacterium sp. 236(2023)]MDG4667447.1 NAD(P)-binding domain-containing protein [Mycobacterium sp. 236(2023)]